MKNNPYDGSPEIESIDKTGIKQRVSGPVTPQYIEKRWGFEKIYANDVYCCKMLVINPGCETSMHLHLQKEETFLVVAGELMVRYIKDKEEESYIVGENEAFTVCPGFPHALVALEKQVKLVEASTPSYDTDSIRIY